MARPATGRMKYLLAARDSGGDDLRLRRGLTHGRKEPHLAYSERQSVVLLLIAERSCHTAAPRIDFFHGETGDHFQEPEGGSGSHQTLLMAVAVEQDRPALVRKSGPPFTGIQLLNQVLIQKQGPA